MKIKGRITGFLCMLLTVAYAIYLIAYFRDALSSDWTGAIATAIVTPHMACIAVAAVMTIIGFFGKKRWGFLVGGILLVVAAVIFLTYAMMVVVQAALAFIAYARMGIRVEWTCKCPRCNSDVSEQMAFCPNCGYPIAAQIPKEIGEQHSNVVSMPATKSVTAKKSKMNLTPLLIVLIAIAVIAITYFSCADFINDVIHFFNPQGNEAISVSSSATTRPTTQPTTRPIAAPTKKPKPSWEKAYYVDDFNEPTSKSYIRGKFTGTFSNVATTDSSLTVYLFVEKDYSGNSWKDNFRIRLIEYDTYIVNFKTMSYSDITIKAKIGDRTISDHPGGLNETQILINRDCKLFYPILLALESGEEIKIVIEESQYTTSTYRFTINANGLEDIDHNWMIK